MMLFCCFRQRRRQKRAEALGIKAAALAGRLRAKRQPAAEGGRREPAGEAEGSARPKLRAAHKCKITAPYQ